MVRHVALLLVGILATFQSAESAGGLVYDYYKSSCPQAEKIIYDRVLKLYEKKGNIATSLFRYAFHDCSSVGFVSFSPTFIHCSIIHFLCERRGVMAPSCSSPPRMVPLRRSRTTKWACETRSTSTTSKQLWKMPALERSPVQISSPLGAPREPKW